MQQRVKNDRTRIVCIKVIEVILNGNGLKQRCMYNDRRCLNKPIAVFGHKFCQEWESKVNSVKEISFEEDSTQLEQFQVSKTNTFDGSGNIDEGNRTSEHFQLFKQRIRSKKYSVNKPNKVGRRIVMVIEVQRLFHLLDKIEVPTASLVGRKERI